MGDYLQLQSEPHTEIEVAITSSYLGELHTQTDFAFNKYRVPAVQ